MGYSATTGVILYWKPYQTFIIHRAHHAWFDEYKITPVVAEYPLKEPKCDLSSNFFLVARPLMM